MIDCNLLAYEYYKNQFVPKEIYPSGEKEETKLIDKYGASKKENAVLVLKDDIVNDEGYGLKKGFYNIAPDENMDFLMIFQSGMLKAKVPIVKMIVHETNNPEQKKPKKMSAKAYKKWQQKEYRKYLKGENPSEVEYKDAQIHYLDELGVWLLIYNSNNTEFNGIIKF